MKSEILSSFLNNRVNSSVVFTFLQLQFKFCVHPYDITQTLQLNSFFKISIYFSLPMHLLFFLFAVIFFELPITRAPANSNFLRFPQEVRAIGSRLQPQFTAQKTSTVCRWECMNKQGHSRYKYKIMIKSYAFICSKFQLERIHIFSVLGISSRAIVSSVYLLAGSLYVDYCMVDTGFHKRLLPSSGSSTTTLPELFPLCRYWGETKQNKTKTINLMVIPGPNWRHLIHKLDTTTREEKSLFYTLHGQVRQYMLGPVK